MQTLKSFFFLLKTAAKFRNLQIGKTLNTDTSRLKKKQFTDKNNSAVGKSGYLYG